LSDHADWDALIRTIDDTGAERVFVTHGYTHQLARYLADRGLDAHPWRTQYEGEPESDEMAISKTQGPSSNDRGEDRNHQ
jgi:putative mRNA 3-end processing factor